MSKVTECLNWATAQVPSSFEVRKRPLSVQVPEYSMRTLQVLKGTNDLFFAHAVSFGIREKHIKIFLHVNKTPWDFQNLTFVGLFDGFS